jgi:hypothetical protein
MAQGKLQYNDLPILFLEPVDNDTSLREIIRKCLRNLLIRETSS